MFVIVIFFFLNSRYKFWIFLNKLIIYLYIKKIRYKGRLLDIIFVVL